MNGCFTSNVFQCHLHDFVDPMFVDLTHAERLDVVLTQDSLLTRVHIAEADIDYLPCGDEVLRTQPIKNPLVGGRSQASNEGDWHPVDVTAVARFRGVDVSMCIYPNQRDFGWGIREALSDCPRYATDRADCDGMVAAQSQRQPTLSRLLVDKFAHFLGHSTDAARVLHAPHIRVIKFPAVADCDLWLVVVEVTDFRVPMQSVAEVFVQLGKQAGLN